MKPESRARSISRTHTLNAVPHRRIRVAAASRLPREAERDARLLELLPQVRYIARRIHSRLPAHVPFDDLLQAGVLGLLDALRKFDPRRKVQLESYMKFRIRGAILDELRSLDWSPRELRRKARRIEEAERQLRARLGREPATPELARAMGISIGQFHQLVGELRGLDLASLQQVASASEDGMEQDHASRVPSPEANSPLAICSGQEQRLRLEEGIRTLPERERLALTLYYYEELTMKEVGEVLAVGESRVSQLHSSALARLRGCLNQLAAEPAHDSTSREGVLRREPLSGAC